MRGMLYSMPSNDAATRQSDVALQETAFAGSQHVFNDGSMMASKQINGRCLTARLVRMNDPGNSNVCLSIEI